MASHAPVTRRSRRSLAVAAALAGLAAGGSPTAAAAATHLATAPAAVTRASAAAIVGEAPLPGGGGLWVARADGTVSAVGAAVSYGDMGGRQLTAPIRAIAATADGRGYWLLGADGGIFSFGDAQFFGSTGAMHLNRPVVGLAPTADDGGYWLVASDGGIFSFGDAAFHGSTGAMHLVQPIVGMAATPTGAGYWLVAADGGIFSFGDAAFEGSTGAMRLASPVVGMAAAAGGAGYWLVAGDGGVFPFGSANFAGSAAGTLGGASAVGIIPAGAGYWIPCTDGTVRAFGVAAPAGTPVQAATTANPLADPAVSEAPPAGFASACYTVADNATCDAVAEQAIDAARALEGLGPIALPGDFTALDPVTQLVVVTNAERTARGLPAFAGPTPSLDSLALQGAQANADPTGPAGVSWSANWAGGTGTPLAADYLWMYDDGLGSSNIDCSTATPSGCWGHRHDILVPFAGSMGAASTVVGGWTSLATLMAQE
ncbi:MAG TPA: hypothetical protein VFP61_13835 [Acidimicrobiales bacterium]|nr:hypothetical protein [Acidimicrobiales bacterium]